MITDKISCVIPFFVTSGTEHRIKNIEFLLKWLIEIHGYKNLEIIICQQYKEKPADYSFFYKYDNVKHITVQKDMDVIYYSWLMNYAVKKTTRDYIILSDSDAICDLRPSIEIIDSYDYILPYNRAHCLNQTNSAEFIKYGNLKYIEHILKYEIIAPHYNVGQVNVSDSFSAWNAGTFGSYMSIIKKSAYFDIGGYDENSKGWGCNDSIFSTKIKQFLKYKIVPNMIFHLYHLTELQYGNVKDKTDRIERNKIILKKLQEMNKEELRQYIDSSKDKIGV